MNYPLGKLIVLSGPSGAGKSTVVKRLLEKEPNVYFSVSVTTREQRPGEIDGIHYHFITKQQFHGMIQDDELLEYAQYVDNLYGSPTGPAAEMLEKGCDVLFDVDVQGALQIKRRRKDAVLLFMIPPSVRELESRLRARGDVPHEKVVKRLETARWEYSQAKHYEYIVVNDAVESAVTEIRAIILAEKCKIENRIYLMEEI